MFKKLHVIERKALKSFGLHFRNDINILDIPIKIGIHNFIHTLTGGKFGNPPLLLIHGYGGAGFYFSCCIKELSKDFKVYIIDIPGMGSSSRIKYDCKEPEEAREFFCNCIEEWRKALCIDRMFIGGHSFGGYIAGMYTLAFPERVKKCLLISAAGFTRNRKKFD